MISDEDRKALSDMVFRALDTIEEEYGEDASLECAALVFEVRYRPLADSPDAFTVHWKMLRTSSPLHVCAMLHKAGDCVA